MTAEREPSPEAAALHQQLVDVSAHAEPVLAAVLRALIGVHHPRVGRSINSLECDMHNPHKAARNPMFRVDEYEACPRCVVTTFDICSCWACGDYPCKTLRPVLEALGIRADPQVNALPAPAGKQAKTIKNQGGES